MEGADSASDDEEEQTSYQKYLENQQDKEA
jgi:hypothetical protein